MVNGVVGPGLLGFCALKFIVIYVGSVALKLLIYSTVALKTRLTGLVSLTSLKPSIIIR